MRLSLSDQSRTHLQALLTPIEIEALLDVCDRIVQGHAPLWLMGYVTRIVESRNESTPENTRQGREEGGNALEVSKH